MRGERNVRDVPGGKIFHLRQKSLLVSWKKVSQSPKWMAEISCLTVGTLLDILLHMSMYCNVFGRIGQMTISNVAPFLERMAR